MIAKKKNDAKVQNPENWTNQAQPIRAFIIYNPVAGTSNAKNITDRLKKTLEEKQLAYAIHEWQSGEDLDAVIGSAVEKGYTRFIAMGGDGTFSNVANSLVNRQIPIGFIPTGSTNVMARELNIPLTVNRAIDLCLNGNRTRSIDAMQIDGRHYFLNVGIGISAKAIENTRREEKRKIAWLAYVQSGLAQLSGIHLKRFHVSFDDRQTQARASEVHITNLGLIGFEPFRWSEDIQPDDGLLDVHVLRARTLMDYLKVGVNMVLRRSRKSRALRSFQARRQISVECEDTLPVQADGDLIGKTPITIQLVPNSVQVVVSER